MKKVLIILSICIMQVTAQAINTPLKKNAKLIEEWTISVYEIHLRGYYEIYSFYDNGQFVFKRKDYSNMPDFSITGTYYYHPETDIFFLTYPEYRRYNCIQAVKKGDGEQSDEMTVMYYENWGIDDSGNYYVDAQSAKKLLYPDKILVRRKLE